MRHTDWFNYGGVFRDVDLIRLPEVFIKDFFVHLLPDRGFDEPWRSVIELSDPVDGEAVLVDCGARYRSHRCRCGEVPEAAAAIEG